MEPLPLLHSVRDGPRQRDGSGPEHADPGQTAGEVAACAARCRKVVSKRHSCTMHIATLCP